MTVLVTKKDIKINNNILKILSKEWDFSATEITSHLKEDRIVKVRFMAWYVLKNIHSIPVSVIALIYKRDPSTILNGVRRVDELKLKKSIPKSLIH